MQVELCEFKASLVYSVNSLLTGYMMIPCLKIIIKPNKKVILSNAKSTSVKVLISCFLHLCVVWFGVLLFVVDKKREGNILAQKS